MWKLLFNFLLTAILSLSGCGALSGQTVRPEQVEREPYRFQPGDELEISLVGRPDSEVKSEVREDGTLLYPAIGSISAAGKSIRQMEEEISQGLQTDRAEFPEAAGPELDFSTESISSAAAAQQIYHPQTGDLLDIFVWDHPELSQKIQVRDDGLFQFPLIGEVKATGRPIPEVEKEIRDRLNQDYIVEPQVTVRVTGAQYSVLGAKGDSGSFPLEGTLDLLSAISKAGDISTLRSSRVEVIRRHGNKQFSIRADVGRILAGKEINISILPRDTIYVKLPSTVEGDALVAIRLLNAKFTVLGEVSSPGSFPIEGPVDLLTAISVAGGITKFGSSHVEVIRTVVDQKRVIRSNVDRVLRGKEPNISILPRDTLYVRRRLF